MANHVTVNHSQHFLDPETGVCTNHMEAYWSAVKRKFKQMYSINKNMLPSFVPR